MKLVIKAIYFPGYITQYIHSSTPKLDNLKYFSYHKSMAKTNVPISLTQHLGGCLSWWLIKPLLQIHPLLNPRLYCYSGNNPFTPIMGFTFHNSLIIPGDTPAAKLTTSLALQSWFEPRCLNSLPLLLRNCLDLTRLQTSMGNHFSSPRSDSLPWTEIENM